MHNAGFLISLAFCFFALACGGDSSPSDATASPVVSATAAPVVETATPDRVVTIAAVGDVMLARGLVTLMDEHGAAYPFERVRHLLRDADLTIANLEGTFTERGRPADKLYTFRTPPRFAPGLAGAGIDLVSLGNNHAADFGPESLEDTLAALDASAVRYAGAGMDRNEARRPVVVEAAGLRIAFLSYTDVPCATFATGRSPGVARATVGAIGKDVRAARERADVVVVLLHFGVEYTDAPQPVQQKLARAAVDSGAALVLGHHPHALQGWEWYQDGLIVYSLGNFVFDLDADDLANLGPRAFETVVLSVTLDAGGVLDVQAEPVVIDVVENRPRPATPDEAEAILQRLDELNEIAGGP